MLDTTPGLPPPEQRYQINPFRPPAGFDGDAADYEKWFAGQLYDLGSSQAIFVVVHNDLAEATRRIQPRFSGPYADIAASLLDRLRQAALRGESLRVVLPPNPRPTTRPQPAFDDVDNRPVARRMLFGQRR